MIEDRQIQTHKKVNLNQFILILIISIVKQRIMSSTPKFAPRENKQKWKTVPTSQWINDMCNPIREIVEQIKMPGPGQKNMMPLSIGDPTVFGNLHMSKTFRDAIIKNVTSEKFNGYCSSVGRPEARIAIAKYYQTKTSLLTEDDVIICSGASGAIEIALKAMASPGENILLPKPGFSLYQTIAEQYGIECRYYDLIAEKNWEANLEQMEEKVDEKTKLIFVNNPSNPCGSVYSKEHLEAIIKVACRNKLPIISDEIYGNMCFTGSTFYPLASLTDEVPVIAIGGIAKEFLVPGYRVGWILLHDRNDVLKHVIDGMKKLTQLIIGSNTLVQSALPSILTPTKGSQEERELENWRKATMDELEQNAMFTLNTLQAVPGLNVIVPQGAMYVMVGIDIELFDTISNDLEFTQTLLDEESVFVIPGSCFKMPNYFRVVFSAPHEKLKEAYERIDAFCSRHCHPKKKQRRM